PGDHAVEPAGGDEIDGMDAEGRGDQAIGRVRLAAALDVTEHGDAGFGPGPLGELLAEQLADAAQRGAAAAVPALDLLAKRVLDGLGDDDEREVAAALAYPLDMAGDVLDRVGDLGDEDDIGATGDPGGEGDVAGIAPH